MLLPAFRSEDLGLLYEDRPKIFSDVENTMQQRLTLIEETSTSNLVAAKGGARAQLKVPKVEGGEALPAIGEEGEAPEAPHREGDAAAAAAAADGAAAEEGEKGHAEEGGDGEGAAKGKKKEQEGRKTTEAAGDHGLHQSKKAVRKFVDSCGIMVSLADPVKVRPVHPPPDILSLPSPPLLGPAAQPPPPPPALALPSRLHDA